MRIGINLLYLIPGVVGGTETYARELISSLMGKMDKADRIIIFCSKETSHTFIESVQLKVVALPFSSSNRVARIATEQVFLPICCYLYNLNILLSLGYSQPLLLPCKSIVAIHDLNWYYHPKDFSKLALFFWKYLTLFSANRSDAIITISESTKDSLVSVLKIDSAKITVIYLGMGNLAMNQESDHRSISQKYSLPKKYILTILSHYPHKNIETLIQAFIAVQKKVKDLHLVIGGTGTDRARIERKKYLRAIGNNSIHLLPFIGSNDLEKVYENASIFVFSSAYEGFGLPVLEAMSHKIPVISSNAYSLKEVVGNGGILVNPYDVKQYIINIEKLLNSSNLRLKYINAGIKQANKFTWDKCGYETLALIRKIYGSR